MSTGIMKRLTRRIQRRKDKRKQVLHHDDDESTLSIMGHLECSPMSNSPLRGATPLHDGGSGSTGTLESSTTMESSDGGFNKQEKTDMRTSSSDAALLRSTSQQVVVTTTTPSIKRQAAAIRASSEPVLVTPSPKRGSRSPRRHVSESERSVGEQQQLERIVKAASALDKSGNELFERGDYDRAMASYKKALKLKQRTLNALDDDEEENADDSFDDVKNGVTGTSDVMLASVATSINNIGYLRQRSGASSDETMAAYMDSLHIKRQILGKHDLSVGKTLNNIGSVHFSTQNFAQAMKAYEEARHIMILNLGEEHLDVATVESNLGDVHLARGEGEKARIKYREALKIRWTLLGDHHPKVSRLLEKIAMIEMKEEMKNIALNPSLSHADHTSDDEEDDDRMPVQKALGNLRTQVRQDIRHVCNVQRVMALDMVKDKLKMFREMRAMDQPGYESLCDDGGQTKNDEGLKEPQMKQAPLSPCDRSNALVGVRERLAKFRESSRKRDELFSSQHSNGGISALRRLAIEDDAPQGETAQQEKTES